MSRPWWRHRGQDLRGVFGGDERADNASHGSGMKLPRQRVEGDEMRDRGKKTGNAHTGTCRVRIKRED